MALLADPETQLAWEARQRPRAGIAGIFAGFALIAGYMWLGIAFKDSPPAGFLESLAQAEKPGLIGDQPSLRTPSFRFSQDHAATVIGSSLLRALAYVAFAWAITFLAAATRARRPELARPVVYIGLLGAVLFAIAALLAVTSLPGVSDYLEGPLTVDAAHETRTSSLLVMAGILDQMIGPLALAAGLFLVSLNAMRVGLLTRFLGIIGIIAGVVTVAPQLMPLPVIQAFWLVAVGLMLLGRTPSGAPPAWATGNAEPWPSQRRTPRQQRAPTAPTNGDGEGEGLPGGRPHPSSKKRKRKRRG